MTIETHFLDARDNEFVVRPLTLEVATVYADRLVEIHNGILNQYWTNGNLLANSDAQREFAGKWEISTFTSRAKSCVPIGFCIGFETPSSPYFPEAGVYMHRTALLNSERGCGIGAIMHVETMLRIFRRPLRYVHAISDSAFPAYGQTSNAKENQRALAFWLDAGFEIIGEKPYLDRVDYVMRMTKMSVLRSRHYQLWQRGRASALSQ